MDRPASIVRMTPATMGIRTVSAVMPEDLAARAQAVIDAFAASAETYPFLTGFELAGGGAGATWRITLKAAAQLGWEEQSACFCGAAHIICRTAREEAELDTVCAQILADIALVPSAFVWDLRIAGGGADGTYMVAVLYSEGISGFRETNIWIPATLGPYAVATSVCNIIVPGTNSGGVDDQDAYDVWWSCGVADSDGSGVIARLIDVTGTLQEYQYSIPTATDWWCASGYFPTTQFVGATDTFEIEVAPVGANTVSVREISLCVRSAVRSGEPS